MDESQLGELQD
jgi:hypothetical protein